MIPDSKQLQIGVRLPEKLVKQADKLATAMSQDGASYTRSDILRMAAHRGMEQIEAERKKKR